MNREDYLQNLKQGNFGLIAYYYFVECSGIYLTTEDFSTLFSDYLSRVTVKFMLDGDSLLEYCENKAIEYFSDKFQVNLILREEQVVGVY